MVHGLTQRPVSNPAAMDNAVAIAYLPSNLHARNYLLGIDAGYSVAVAGIKNITIRTGPATVDGLLNSAGLVLGTTKTDVGSVAFQYVISRVAYAKAAVAAGTALAAGTIPADKWGLYLFSTDSASTITSTAAAANFAAGYDNEAAAIAALPATPASEDSMGYVTVKTAAGTAFIGGTDDLKTGAAGNVASETNYVQTAPITLTTITTVPWDFNAGAYARSYGEAEFHTQFDQALAVELAASGAGSTLGSVTMWVKAP